ncbi:MAG: hypothetical protein D6675_06805, partial [Gemmatimonadetes bacterium]
MNYSRFAIVLLCWMLVSAGNVMAQASMEVDPASYDVTFDYSQVDQLQTFTITNTGDQDLSYSIDLFGATYNRVAETHSQPGGLRGSG